MNISELSENLAIIQQLSDHPNDQDGLTPDKLKAKFDEAAGIIKKYLNEIVVPAVNRAVSKDKNGDVNIGGREFTAGKVIICSDPEREGFYMKSSLEGDDNASPVAEMSGTNDDGIPVIIRNVAPGINDNDVVNKKQLDDVAENVPALIVTFTQENWSATHSVSEILNATRSGRDVFLKLPGEESYLPLVSVDEDGWFAQFCRFSENVLTILEIRDDSEVSVLNIPLGNAAKIDDTKVGADAWSSKNIIDKLCPSFERSGALVQCEPVEGYPLFVSAKEDSEIEGVTVTVFGKNLYDKTSYPLNIDGYPYSSATSSGAFATSDNYRRTGFIPVMHLRGQTIVLNHSPSKYGTVSNPGISFYKYEPNVQSVEDCKAAWCGGTTGASIKVPDDAEYMVFCVRKQDSPIGSDPKDIQIEIGSQSTGYDPYLGEIFEAVGDATAEFIQVASVVGRAGLMTFFAKNGKGEITEVKVSGKADPVAIIEKLTNAVISLGGII